MSTKARKYDLIALGCLLLGAGWVWWSKLPPNSTTPGLLPLPRQGFAAPDFSLPAADGVLYNLQDLRGRPVIINLWASWCPPCREEMPALEQVFQDYQAQGLLVLAVNATNQDDIQSALDFAEAAGVTFPILLDGSGEVSRLYLLRALPTTFFVDRQGVIREMVVGGPMAEALLRIRAEQLLQEAR